MGRRSSELYPGSAALISSTPRPRCRSRGVGGDRIVSSISPWILIDRAALFFFFFSLPTLLTSSLAQETLSNLTTIYNSSCGGASGQGSSAFTTNKLTLSNTFLTDSSTALFGNFSTNYFVQDLQGFYQCRGDLTLDLCHTCVTTIIDSAQLNACGSMSFRADAGGCSMLYINATDNLASNSSTYLWSSTNQVSTSGFGPAVDSLLTNLTSVVSSSSVTTMFAKGNSSLGSNARVYALVQCFGILNKSQCTQCLSSLTSSSVLDMMGNATEGKIFFGSCFALFSSLPFYSEVAAVPPAPNNGTSASTSTNNTSKLALGIGLGLGFLLVFAALLFYYKYRTKKRKQTPGNQKEDALEDGFRIFSIEELRRATQNFHQKNVLGRGGFGQVYKGVLDNGEIVAVKKLALISDQAETQFVAEVKFITSVQHRNLIRLHGYCVDSMERILVYEFLPNQSLDKHIFSADMSARRMLSWKKRLDILMGTARGLAYMHHDCHQRIIHRDIKAANILLDESMNPKIADFGLARLFGTDKSHVDTGVAGTLGYLAPEYFLHGQLTEKADVYSFGIVMLEVVSGRKVIENDLNDKENLLQWAWNLYKSERVSELVDIALGNEYEIEEVTQVVSLALSCTQESFSARPTMNNVVAILGNNAQYMGNQLIPSQPIFGPQTDPSTNSWSSTSDQSSLSSSYTTSSFEMTRMLLPHSNH